VAWSEVFIVFVLCHLVGDYVVQTDWQARCKHHGLSGGESLRALSSHIATYTLCFIPAIVWLADDLSPLGTVATVAAISVPHLIQDDGRLLAAYMVNVKKLDLKNTMVASAVDQTFHMLALFALALVVGR
jgi:hypothetical protein